MSYYKACSDNCEKLMNKNVGFCRLSVTMPRVKLKKRAARLILDVHPHTPSVQLFNRLKSEIVWISYLYELVKLNGDFHN